MKCQDTVIGKNGFYINKNYYIQNSNRYTFCSKGRNKSDRI